MTSSPGLRGWSCERKKTLFLSLACRPWLYTEMVDDSWVHLIVTIHLDWPLQRRSVIYMKLVACVNSKKTGSKRLWNSTISGQLKTCWMFLSTFSVSRKSETKWVTPRAPELAPKDNFDVFLRRQIWSVVETWRSWRYVSHSEADRSQQWLAATRVWTSR